MNPPRVIADYACRTGERPLWHAAERRLYWVDIPAGKLFRYDPLSGQHEQVYQGRPIGGFTIQADGSLLLFMDRGTVAVWRDGRLSRTIIDEIPAELDTRFNDVIADPAGRVFCGTMSVKDAQGNVVRYGRLYRLDIDGSLHELADGVATSNGMGFTRDERTMYHTETGRYTIWQYDYDRVTGAITNRRPFIVVPRSPSNARPDGLTVDAEDHVWSAHYDGGCVVRYTPTGDEQQRIVLPTPQTTCPAFGSPQFDELYITTAGGDAQPGRGSAAGALYAVNPGVPGRAEFLSRIS